MAATASIPHPCLPDLDHNAWLRAFGWSWKQLSPPNKDIKDSLTSKMSLEEQSTLLFDIYFQEEKMFHLFLVCAFPFKVHLIAIFSLWAFFFFHEQTKPLVAIKELKMYGLWNQYSLWYIRILLFWVLLSLSGRGRKISWEVYPCDYFY